MKKSDLIISELEKEFDDLRLIHRNLQYDNQICYASGNSGNSNPDNNSVDSGNKKSYVKITVNRVKFGKTTTLSNFEACAYNSSGEKLNSVTGYFLEPEFDESRNTIDGSDTAIPGGTYDVEPSTYHGRSGFFEIKGVSGRSAIKIHSGNTGADTEGCLMPGTGCSFDESTGDYRVTQSKAKFNELRDFLNLHSSGLATITITP